MSDPIEPVYVVDLVERYIGKELRDAVSYENRTPLDESGIYSLHLLAAEIYAVGHRDGASTESRRVSSMMLRRKEAADS